MQRWFDGVAGTLGFLGVLTVVSLGALVSVVLGILALDAPSAYRRHVTDRGATLTGEDRACRFVGHFSTSEIPVARLIGEDEPWIQPGSDAFDRFLAPEAAKPFHFGLVILRDGDLPPEVWGWSYRTSSFWRDDGGLLRLAYRGNVAADCLATLEGARRGGS